MKRLLIVPILALTLAAFTPAVQAQVTTGDAPTEAIDDTYPPLIPVGALLRPHFVHHVENGGSLDEYCGGRFVLRGGCDEFRAYGIDALHIGGWIEPIPTGDGTEVEATLEVRLYDLDNDGQLIHTCQETKTWSSPFVGGVFYEVGTGIGAFCTHFVAPRDSGVDVHLRVEVESNSTGFVNVGASQALG